MSELKDAGWISRYFHTNKYMLFVFWCLANVLVVYLNQQYLLTDRIYYQTYGERVALERIDAFLELKATFWWMGYVFIPLTLLFKVALISLALTVGALLADVKAGFGRIFGMVLSLEGIFILANLMRVLWLIGVVGAEHLDQVNYFYPLSLVNFFGPDVLPAWLIYPVTLVNLFEGLYFVGLAWGMRFWTGRSFKLSFLLVLASYGIGLLIWATLIAFLSISFS